MAKRRTIPPKVKLKVLKRDKYTCQICGKSPASYPELELEVDHIEPVSKDGGSEIDNLQTLCILCNRGKGNDSGLNMTTKDRLDILLDRINPEIREQIEANKSARVVANDTDFQELLRLNEICHAYKIDVIPNTIFGYQDGHSMGIYTVRDIGGAKVNFVIRI